MKSILKNLILGVLKTFNLTIVKKTSLVDFYLHEYKSYKEYEDIQIFHNKRKIKSVFADKKTLKRVNDILIEEFPNNKKIKGICHGSRNGFEQNLLNSLNNKLDVFGTDISETAENFKNSIQYDFNKNNKSWISNFHFIYSNSLDQSCMPKTALKTWLSQLKPEGILILEHTEDHGPNSAGEMDPFGVRPTVLPYVLTMWFGSQISIEHSVRKKSNADLNAWLFVIRKNVKSVNILK